jgi:hypothetical protein
LATFLLGQFVFAAFVKMSSLKTKFVGSILKLISALMLIFWAFILNFNIDILSFFDSATVLATFLAISSQSSGHPASL